MSKTSPTTVEDKSLLNLIGGIINENDSGKAFIASKYHEEAYKKIRQAQSLLDEAHAHLNASKDLGVGGEEHARHINKVHEHLNFAKQSLTDCVAPLSNANTITARR